MASSKKQILNTNKRRLKETTNDITEYIQELYDRDEEWKKESGQISPYHLKNAIMAKDKELEEWRNLIPNCNTVKSAKQFLKNKKIGFNDISEPQISDPSFISYHESFPNKKTDFKTLTEFNKEKETIRKFLFNPTMPLETVRRGDFKNMIDFFIYEYENHIEDPLVDVYQVYRMVNHEN